MPDNIKYNIVMINTSKIDTARAYTPEQVASMLQLSKNTVYELIGKGDIVAKRIGKVYRIPATSLSFIFTGLDYDLYQAEAEDKKALQGIQTTLEKVRREL